MKEKGDHTVTSLFQGRRGISPLVATILLIAFSVGVGAVVMSFGESYIEERAEFVEGGGSEVAAGCSAVKLEVIAVSGARQACQRGANLEVALDNGPAVDVAELHVRALGIAGIAVRENVLGGALARANAARLDIPLAEAGELKQVKLTPKVLAGQKAQLCDAQAVLLENLPQC
jgi:flagellin-like protein